MRRRSRDLLMAAFSMFAIVALLFIVLPRVPGAAKDGTFGAAAGLTLAALLARVIEAFVTYRSLPVEPSSDVPAVRWWVETQPQLNRVAHVLLSILVGLVLAISVNAMVADLRNTDLEIVFGYSVLIALIYLTAVIWLAAQRRRWRSKA